MTSRRLIVLACAAVVALCAPAAAWADGYSAPALSLDTFFAPTSGIARTDFTPPCDPPGSTCSNVSATPYATAVDGNVIYTVGESNTGANGDVAISAYNSDGTVDTGFGDNGKKVIQVASGTEDRGVGIVVLPDHHLRVLVSISPKNATTFSATADGAIVGLLPDGTVDATWGGPTDNGVMTFENAWHEAGGALGSSSPIYPDTPSAIALAPDGRIAVTGDSATSIGGSAQNDNTFVAMFTAGGQLDQTFGANGLVLEDRSGTATADAGVDVAFRPGGGIAVLDEVGDLTVASAFLDGYTDTGADDPSFGSGSSVALSAGAAPTVPTRMVIRNGQIWATGSTRSGTDTNAFVSRLSATDGSGQQSRQFDMPGTLFDPSQALTSEGDGIAMAPGVNGTGDSIVIVGKVTGQLSSTTATEYAAAVFNNLDGDLANMGFDSDAITTPNNNGLNSVAASSSGWVAVGGPYYDSYSTPTSSGTVTRFGIARFLISGGTLPAPVDPNAGKSCDLALSTIKPLELSIPWGQTTAATFQVGNAGTLGCAGAITAPSPWTLSSNGVTGPITTALVAPLAAFSPPSVRIGYSGTLRSDAVLTLSLASAADANAANNSAAVHVRFAYCDAALRAAHRPEFVPSEGAVNVPLTVSNPGTSSCSGVRVAVSGAGKRAGAEKAYTVAAGHNAADDVAVRVKKPGKPGSKVKLSFKVSLKGDPRSTNDSVSVTSRLLDVGDSNASKPSGHASVVRGTASPGRGPAAKSRLKVTRVDVGIRRLGGGCRWLASSSGRFLRKTTKSCPTVWLKASGTSHWHLRTGGLPKGRYELFSRATIGAGFHEASFTSKDRNNVLFHVG